jgi:hypothetical protein
MKTPRALKYVLGASAAFLLVLLVVRLAIAAPTQTSSEPYRVELVANDVYKVQKALNANAAQGWWYVSSISRPDGKLLLVFRSAQ